MMASRCIQRNREYRGIQPNSVAIRAKNPSTKLPDWMSEKNKAFDAHLHEIEARVNEQRKRDLLTEFELNGERRILQVNINRRVKSLSAAQECNLECRREKLQNLLANEEACFMKEMEEQEETVLERQAKMRERAKYLKDKRESVRLAFVQEKYDQQFRSQCEELRTNLSKKQLEQVCLDRLDQIHQKEEMELEKKATDDMYARLWEQDMLEKAAREEREVKDLHEKNRSVLEVLKKQMAAVEAQKEEAKQLVEEEAQLMKEQKALWKMEDDFKQQEKLNQQKATRDMLDQSLVYKAKRKAKLEQEELAFDLKILEQLLKESENEAMATIQRKKERREEDLRYQEYIRKLKEEEKAKQKELDKIIEQDVEAAWEKRLQQWRNNRLARKLLLNDVMECRARQIKERLQENEYRQQEAAREREKLLHLIEENKRQEAEEAARLLANNVQYHHDLLGQISYNTRIREGERELEREEFLKALQTEKEFQARKMRILNNPLVEKVHPLRKAILAHIKNC